MGKKATGHLVPFAVCVAVMLCSVLTADAALVQPLYQMTDFAAFGPIVAGPLTANFGSGFPQCVGTLTTTVRMASTALDLNNDAIPEILPGDLTFIYQLTAGSWQFPFTNILDYLQVHLPLFAAQIPLVAAGYNTAVSNVALKRLNTETEANFQLEFGDDLGGSPDALKLSAGKRIEMFVSFRCSDFIVTDALVDGGGLPVAGIPTMGPVPEPSSILLVLGGIGLALARGRLRR